MLTLGTAFVDTNYGTVYAILNGGSNQVQGQFAQGASFTVTNPNNNNLDTFDIYYNVNATNTGPGNFVDVELEPVPEPGTWAMVLGGAGMLIAWQQRHRRRRERLPVR